MKEIQFNLDDIEEVETTPRRRHRHNHSHNNYQNDYKTVNAQYEHNHSHHHHHHNDNSNVNLHNNDINRNFGSNINTNHHRHSRPEWSEFGCKQVILMSIFVGSLAVVLLSFFVNLILTIKQVVTPRFFLPSIVLIILSFSFGGGILGTYMSPPGMRRPIPKSQLLIMRAMIPIIMLIVSIIFIMIGVENVKSLKKDINKAEDLCKENKGLSMVEIYIKSNDTFNLLKAKKNNMIYSLHHNLNCFPNAKCVKLNQEDNNYICNSKNFSNNENQNIKCNTIDINDNSNQLLNNFKNRNDANLFIENCIDIFKNFLKADNNLFKCESEYNLENIQFVQNLAQENDDKIINYLNNKVKTNNNELQKYRDIVIKYENSRYNYDLECLSKTDYKMSYLMINIYLYVFYFFCLFWIIFGIYSMHQIINLGMGGKLKNLIDEKGNLDRNNIKNYISNKLEVDGEDNNLIIENKKYNNI